MKLDPSGLRPSRLLPPPSKSDAQRALGRTLAHRADAEDLHRGLVHRARLDHADLRGDVVHQQQVRIDQQVALAPEHPRSARLAAARRDLRAVRPGRTCLGHRKVEPHQRVPAAEVIPAALELAEIHARLRALQRARTGGLLAHIAEEQRRPIGFLMAAKGEAAIDYDGDTRE